MTKEQFHTLLQSPGTINLNLVSELEDITERFPYFQNAHLLLAKQYHGHQNIRYESYLRKAAAYSPNRSRLFQLIKATPGEVVHHEEPSGDNILVSDDLNKTPMVAVTTEPEIIPATDVDKSKEEFIKEDLPTPENSAATPPLPVEPIAEANKPDPRDILEQRLKELEQRSQDDNGSESSDNYDKEITESSTPAPENPAVERIDEAEVKEEVSEQVTGEITTTATGNPGAGLDKEIPEHPFEESEDIEEQPVRLATPAKVTAPEVHSYSEWLKIKSIPVLGTLDAPGLYDISKLENDPSSAHDWSQSGKDQIIDSFIKSEPRIGSARSEFYSPGNMARKSAIDHEELISETLARIYAQQGNTRKAIDTYQRLSLKKPEKSSYFAALIKELENQQPGEA